jgi:hypothetical protein
MLLQFTAQLASSNPVYDSICCKNYPDKRRWLDVYGRRLKDNKDTASSLKVLHEIKAYAERTGSKEFELEVKLLHTGCLTANFPTQKQRILDFIDDGYQQALRNKLKYRISASLPQNSECSPGGRACFRKQTLA